MKKVIGMLALLASSFTFQQTALAASESQQQKYTLESAPNKFVEAANTRFAYRIIGSGIGITKVRRFFAPFKRSHS